MNETLTFCRDYQNRNGCTRANCKFIHATKEEQNAFQAIGQVPRVLAEHHAALASASSNMTNEETIPQIAMFINESYMAQPPPTPWPPLPPPQAAQPAATSAPPLVHPPLLAPAPQSVPQAQQHRPPPAPTPALTAPSASPTVHQMCPNPANYHAPQAQNSVAMFPMNHPPPMVPTDFDASRPPPPIPTHINQHKRKLDCNENGAGPSKTQKDGPEVQENFCESCEERKRRIEGCKMQMEALHNEEEAQILIYRKKLQEYEMGRDILKSLVEPDMFKLFDDLIEGVQTPSDSLTNTNSSNSLFVSGTSAEPVLPEMMLGGSQRNEPVPSTSRDGESQVARRLNPLGNNPNQPTDMINLVIETFKNSTAPERSLTMESSDTNRVGNNRANGLNHLANGQKTPLTETTRYGVSPGYSGAGIVNQNFGAHSLQATTNYSFAGPSGYGGAGPGLAPAPAPAYAMFHSAIPPPHYYGQNTSTPNSRNIHYNGANRAPVPGPSQGMQPATSPAALHPTHPNTPTYNQMGRHPQ